MQLHTMWVILPLLFMTLGSASASDAATRAIELIRSKADQKVLRGTLAVRKEQLAELKRLKNSLEFRRDTVSVAAVQTEMTRVNQEILEADRNLAGILIAERWRNPKGAIIILHENGDMTASYDKANAVPRKWKKTSSSTLEYRSGSQAHEWKIEDDGKRIIMHTGEVLIPE